MLLYFRARNNPHAKTIVGLSVHQNGGELSPHELQILRNHSSSKCDAPRSRQRADISTQRAQHYVSLIIRWNYRRKWMLAHASKNTQSNISIKIIAQQSLTNILRKKATIHVCARHGAFYKTSCDMTRRLHCLLLYIFNSREWNTKNNNSWI